MLVNFPSWWLSPAAFTSGKTCLVSVSTGFALVRGVGFGLPVPCVMHLSPLAEGKVQTAFCVPQSLAGVLQHSSQPCLLHLRQFHPEEMLQDSESPVGCDRMEADGELRRISGEDYIFQLLSL